MSYFTNFPKISYGNNIVRNILLSVTITTDNVKSISPLTLNEGERSDIVADLLYDRPSFDWLLWMTNDIIDPYYDWYLTSDQLENYVNEKYSNNGSGIHHYEHNTEKYLINQTTYNLMSPEEQTNFTSITNYEYEERLNEQRKFINAVQPTYRSQIVRKLNSALNA